MRKIARCEDFTNDVDWLKQPRKWKKRETTEREEAKKNEKRSHDNLFAKPDCFRGRDCPMYLKAFSVL